MSSGNVSALTIFGRLFVGSYPTDFRNLLGHRSTTTGCPTMEEAFANYHA